jgi:hypothetical protein
MANVSPALVLGEIIYQVRSRVFRLTVNQFSLKMGVDRIHINRMELGEYVPSRIVRWVLRRLELNAHMKEGVWGLYHEMTGDPVALEKLFSDKPRRSRTDRSVRSRREVIFRYR